MARKKPTEWDKLKTLIEAYADACRADEMKGGGDPDQMDIIEKECELARLKLDAQLRYMEERL